MSGSEIPATDRRTDLSECRNLARNLRRLRKTRGESQPQLAARTGMSQKFISELENEKANPSLRTLSELAAHLGVTVAELIAPNDTMA